VAYYNRGVLLAERGSRPEALDCFRRAVQLDPGVVRYHCDLAYALSEAGETEAAQAEYQAASALDPDWPWKANQSAWVLATAAQPSRAQAVRALKLAEQVCQATGSRVPASLDTLAVAHAELGHFDEARIIARQALALASAAGQRELAEQIGQHLRLYEEHKTVRQAPTVQKAEGRRQ
jgi:tetratricopeptide (TPR) repeat protein